MLPVPAFDFDFRFNQKNQDRRIHMKEINLRKFYPEIYKEDYIVTLPNEIVEVLIDARRKETAHLR